ncbi:hypothetical protein V6N13_014919 [Hibiscus sabdariffa]
MSCCDVLMAAIPSSRHFSNPQMQQFGFQVERASKPTEHNKPQQTGVQLGNDFSQSASFLKDANSTRDRNQGSRLGSLPASEPIAPRLDVDYPFPPHLE